MDGSGQLGEGRTRRRAKDKLVVDGPISVSALRKIVTEARPLIVASLDASEELAALRDLATEQGIDWSQTKALIKAQIQDEGDDGNRVGKLLAKAANATVYADLLGIEGREENISPQSGAL